MEAGPQAKDPPETIDPQAGFTLVELLTGVATMLIVTAAALAMMNFAVRAEPEVAARNSAIQQAQIHLDRMARDIRQSYGVVSATSSNLVVLTYDGVASCESAGVGDSRACRVTYSCSAGTCTRTSADPSGSPSGTAVQVVSGLSSDAVFDYAPDASSPTVVGITLEFPRRDQTGEDAITLSDQVALRNITASS